VARGKSSGSRKENLLTCLVLKKETGTSALDRKERASLDIDRDFFNVRVHPAESRTVNSMRRVVNQRGETFEKKGITSKKAKDGSAPNIVRSERTSPRGVKKTCRPKANHPFK